MSSPETRGADAPLVFESVCVESSAAEAVIRVTDPRYMRTSAVPGLAQVALEALPGLRRHRCECDSAHGIERELADTESPHLVEHLALELMALSGSPRTLGGETRWDFAADGRGVFHVLVGCEDERTAVAAMRHATALANELLSGASSIDADAMVRELKALRAS